MTHPQPAEPLAPPAPPLASIAPTVRRDAPEPEGSGGTRALLDRYLPDAVREHVDHGVELDQGEREVTVLFVDLHGFTGLAEPLSSQEIHELLGAYVRSVSRQVKRHGGTVVEFNGDGVMAVFGAPNAHASKERAAVAAARAILHEVRRFKDASGHRLPVGVGIATGLAWVGCIETEDRVIWSAVGNTTNLASRLQKLSQDLHTPVIVDDTTRRRAGALAGDFLSRTGTCIRGRSEPLDVWLLPRPSVGDAR